MKKKKYDLTSIFIIVLIFAFLYSIFIFTYSLFKIEKLSFSHQLDFANMDKYSSYLQGIVGLFLNLVTIILVYRTFKQQDDFIIEKRN
jgi:flagellar basal body-associated protein FliL